MKTQLHFLLVSVLLSAAVFPMHALADPILDQSNLPASLGEESDFGGYVQQAQTFQVGITGVLVELDVIGSGSDSFLLDIRGQAESHPDNAVVQETVKGWRLHGRTFDSQPFH